MNLQTKNIPFRLHAFITLITAFSFLVLAASGLILLFTSHGWSIGAGEFIITKRNWFDLHITFGFIFIVAGFMHALTNWRFLLSYFRRRKNSFAPNILARIRFEWIIALILCGYVFIGVKDRLYPVTILMDWLH